MLAIFAAIALVILDLVLSVPVWVMIHYGMGLQYGFLYVFQAMVLISFITYKVWIGHHIMKQMRN